MLSSCRVATIVAAALCVSACGIRGPAHSQPPPPSVAASVTMAMNSFNPGVVRVRPGQSVQWRNTSLITHTVTADPRLAANPANIQLPPGAAAFHSGKIPAGQVWSHIFTTPGTYRYVCLPHERQGMTGTVIVAG